MMIHIVFHQRRRLFRCHLSKESMRMLRASLRPARARPRDQRTQPRAFLSQVALILYHQALRRRRIPPHRFFVLQQLRLRDRPKDPPQKHPRFHFVPHCPLHPHRTVRHRLRSRHLPPLPLAGGTQPPNPLPNFLSRPRFKQVFHTETLPPSTASSILIQKVHVAYPLRFTLAAAGGWWSLSKVFLLDQIFLGRMNRVQMFSQIGTRSPRSNFSANSRSLSGPRPFKRTTKPRSVISYSNTRTLTK